MPQKIKKHKYIPGTVIECKSGRYVAFYEHRTDIIANGENKKEALANLKEMYQSIIDFEKEEQELKNITISIPQNFNTSHFKEKFSIA